MDQKLRWGILSTGAIAKTFARGLKSSQTSVLHAVASRSQEKADAFAREWEVSRAYSSYDALLNDAEIDAVYVSPPHPWHALWAIRACEAKKHVLVEKPFGLNSAQ